jgi:hypothetical protein
MMSITLSLPSCMPKFRIRRVGTALLKFREENVLLHGESEVASYFAELCRARQSDNADARTPFHAINEPFSENEQIMLAWNFSRILRRYALRRL